MMDKNYSLQLPSWGPYNKVYLGAAHIADKEKGLRFDLNLFPGYYRRKVMSVRDIVDSGVKMMAASKDVSHYVYRYEIEWKDQVYIDADFSSKNNVLTVVCNFVNHTDSAESLSLNAVMSMQGTTHYHGAVVPDEVQVDNGIWVDAVDYVDIKTPCKISNNGLYLAERLESGFVGGSFITHQCFGRIGDMLSYNFNTVLCEQIGIRYRGEGNITIKTNRNQYDVNLPYTKGISLYCIPIEKEEVSLLEIYPQDSHIDFDGFVIGDKAEFQSNARYFIPQFTEIDHGAKLTFVDKEYTVKIDYDDYVIRRLKTDCVDNTLTSKMHDHVSKILGNGGHEYIDLFIRPLFVGAHSTKTVTISIIAPESETYKEDHSIVEPICNAEGEKYFLSQKIMSAVTSTNVVWPIYSRRSYTLHNTPGRQWDSHYTWDSGFVGLGLAEIDIDRAIDCLNAYLTPVGDIHSPYILHGTPLPIQIFLYAEIYSKTGDKAFLEKFYPMIYQQYRFFADGRKNGYTRPTGMLTLWDLFYNSGGWDDYPPQQYVHENNLAKDVSPVVNTAMTVLCAKVLKNHAEVLGMDVQEFDEDIEFYSNAIDTYAWDEESGYYGYVKNDGSILKIDGVNADMGMDGVFPFVAGISDENKNKRILDNVKKGMLTPIGVSVVDTRAPYFKKSGYWNGSIWMPHQWILWKACLDNGEIELAETIAKTALDLWEKETAHTYNCYEHFMIENGRGAGFHQFSGLSTPVLMWFSAYYKPYSVTSGFMTVIENKNVTSEGMEFTVNSTANKPVILVCLPENEKFEITVDGIIDKQGGCYTIELQSNACQVIKIKKIL